MAAARDQVLRRGRRQRGGLRVGPVARASSRGAVRSRCSGTPCRESSAAGRGDAYTTTVAVAGLEHVVSLAVEDAAMWIAVDGEKALQQLRRVGSGNLPSY
ncbi:hypothetical protein ACP70R_018356 [Stipagrostis hirtigluma subsp. patula]